MKDISAKEQREIFENLGNEIIKGIIKSITEMQEYNDKQLEEFEKIFKSCLKNSKNKQKIYLISSEKARCIGTIGETIKLGENWQKTENKYKDFYEYIKHLLKNANLDEKLVREKIKEMEREFSYEEIYL